MLTDAQLATLKADILADPVLAAKPNNGDGNFEIAVAYALAASPDYYVWRTDVPKDEIFDAITWANFTPQDTPDNTATWTNRSLSCQGKQFNLQTMLVGRETFNAAKSLLRGGLNDATTNLPSGASGANRSGGWANILTILRRKANRLEKLFSVAGSGVGNNGGDARGATTNPDVMVVEGIVTHDEVQAARNLP